MNPTKDLLSIYFPDSADADAENDHGDYFLSKIVKGMILDTQSLCLETVIHRGSHSIVFQARDDGLSDYVDCIGTDQLVQTFWAQI
ncbi:hypothetical protein SLE2022_355770 [Rubroshorea leprosula]